MILQQNIIGVSQNLKDLVRTKDTPKQSVMICHHQKAKERLDSDMGTDLKSLKDKIQLILHLENTNLSRSLITKSKERVTVSLAIETNLCSRTT
jgi:hypothetical protein